MIIYLDMDDVVANWYKSAQDFLGLRYDERQEALEDLKFVNGDQWPVELQNSRNLESRPILTINKLDGYCRQVTNQQRQQRPRIKVHGTNSQHRLRNI